jgi:hypothetical protein
MVGIRLDERSVVFAFRLGVFLAVLISPTCMIDVAAISSAGLAVVNGLCQNSPTMEPWAVSRSGASGFTSLSGRPSRGSS